MQLVIRITSRLRYAAPRPPEFLPFRKDESLLVYQGRSFATREEFNAAWETVSSPRFPAKGCTFGPLAVEEEAAAETKTPKAPEPEVEEVPEPPAEPQEEQSGQPEPQEEIPAVEEEAARFRLSGEDVFLGDEKIASLSADGGFRMSRGHGELRDEVEAWLMNLKP